MYQALYRKWRPKTFADVVGQAPITGTLRRQAAQNRLSHAYLFTGTRGTGKTTCAKILAKAVNCQHPVDGDPCNACPACLGIDNGSLLDVLELDAASNNGVDSVRALREEAVYSPASVRYRVYIVDEVHMLSVAAFNALLKILEEPPAHLIFILATTELHKVPATILSRCQRFAFRRIRPQDIADRLLYVARQEGMSLTEDAANLLARLSDGALRDGLSLLDQCGAAGGEIHTDRVLETLGLAGNLQTAELMDRVLRRDAQSALLLLDKLYNGGKDIGSLLNELSALARDLLIRMTAPEGGMELLSGGYDTATMDRLSRDVPPRRLLFMVSQLQSVSASLALSSNRRTDAELCLLRLCDEGLCGDTAALSARMARLEDSVRSGAAAPPGSKPSAAAPPPADSRPPYGEPVSPEAVSSEAVSPEAVSSEPVSPEAVSSETVSPEAVSSEPVSPEAVSPEAVSSETVSPEAVSSEPVSAPPRAEKAAAASQPAQAGGGDVWPELAERFKERLTPMYWYMLDDARGVMEEEAMTVYCGDELTCETLSGEEAVRVMREVIRQRLGKDVQLRFALEGAARPNEDKMDELIRRGSKYSGFTVK